MENKQSTIPFKRKYQLIPNEVRLMLINKIFSKKFTIKEAANDCGINFSTAKMIVQIFKKHGRIGKSQQRIKIKRSMQEIYKSQEVVISYNKPQIKMQPITYISRVCNVQQITDKEESKNNELLLKQQKVDKLIEIFGGFLDEPNIKTDSIILNDDCVLPVEFFYKKIYQELQSRSQILKEQLI